MSLKNYFKCVRFLDIFERRT